MDSIALTPAMQTPSLRPWAGLPAAAVASAFEVVMDSIGAATEECAAAEAPPDQTHAGADDAILARELGDYPPADMAEAGPPLDMAMPCPVAPMADELPAENWADAGTDGAAVPSQGGVALQPVFTARSNPWAGNAVAANEIVQPVPAPRESAVLPPRPVPMSAPQPVAGDESSNRALLPADKAGAPEAVQPDPAAPFSAAQAQSVTVHTAETQRHVTSAAPQRVMDMIPVAHQPPAEPTQLPSVHVQGAVTPQHQVSTIPHGGAVVMAIRTDHAVLAEAGVVGGGGAPVSPIAALSAVPVMRGLSGTDQAEPVGVALSGRHATFSPARVEARRHSAVVPGDVVNPQATVGADPTRLSFTNQKSEKTLSEAAATGPQAQKADDCGGLGGDGPALTSTALPSGASVLPVPSRHETALQRGADLTTHPSTPDPEIQIREGATHLRLEPDELGRLDIRVERSDAGVSIVLRAERGESADLMRRNADLLHRELADSGIVGARLDFGQGGHSGRQPGQQAAQAAGPAATLISTSPPELGHVPHPPRPTPLAGGHHVDMRL